MSSWQLMPETVEHLQLGSAERCALADLFPNRYMYNAMVFMNSNNSRADVVSYRTEHEIDREGCVHLIICSPENVDNVFAANAAIA